MCASSCIYSYIASVAAASISSTSFLGTLPALCTVLSGVLELDAARNELLTSELLVLRPLHAAASATATAFAAAAARAAKAGPPRLQKHSNLPVSSRMHCIAPCDRHTTARSARARPNPKKWHRGQFSLCVTCGRGAGTIG